MILFHFKDFFQKKKKFKNERNLLLIGSLKEMIPQLISEKKKKPTNFQRKKTFFLGVKNLFIIEFLFISKKKKKS